MKFQGTTDLLSDEDEKLIKFIQIVKNNISYIIGKEKLIDEMRRIIIESEHFAFRSKRNEKLISLSKPLFVLTFDVDKISQDLEYKFGDNNRDMVFVQRLVQREITSSFSEYLSKQIRDRDVMKDMLKKFEIENISEDDLLLLSFITASIFGINVDMKTKLIYLEYVI